jgi:AraC-like DNA-binding protein
MRSETGQSILPSSEAPLRSAGVRSGWTPDWTTASSRTHNRLRTVAQVPSQRMDTCTQAAHAGFDCVVDNSSAELAHLSGILRQLGCAARLRELDGLDTMRLPIALEPTLSGSIYDPEGRVYATLDLTHIDGERSDALHKLLRVLLAWAASAITERWFRMHYRQYWIIAARHQAAPDTCMILAVDRDQDLVGADRSVRQFLETKRLPIGCKPQLSAVFGVGSAVFKEGPGPDLALQLRAQKDAAQYSVVITPPDPLAVESSHDERLLLHTRPRLHGMTCVAGIATREHPLRPLASHILRRILRYVDTHLDTALSIDDLAFQARLSESHFARCFMKSVGMTPHGYVLRRRLVRAQQLLARSEMSLLEVALTTGFADQSHFCRRFREFVGMTPRAFRARSGSHGDERVP